MALWCLLGSSIGLHGQSTEEHDEHGWLTKVSDPAGGGFIYEYDAVGNRVRLETAKSKTGAPIFANLIATATSDAAQISADLVTNGGATSVQLEWGVGAELGNSTASQVVPPASEATSFAQTLTGLSPGKSYRYRLTAANAGGSATSKIGTFTTPLGAHADLAIARSSLASPIEAGGRSYTLTVTNHAANQATGVFLRETLRGVGEVVSFSQPGAAEPTAVGAKFAEILLGDLPSGASVAVVVTVRESRGGFVYLDGRVSSADVDPNESNNRVLSKYRATSLDTDGDGTPNEEDDDDDGDGLPDAWEIANGLDPVDSSDADLDPDADGFTSRLEHKEGTSPTDASSYPVSLLGCGWDWVNPTPSGGELNGAAIGNGVDVVVGDTGLILVRANGGEWRTAVSGTDMNLNDVAWSGSEFVAVGAQGSVRSEDGLHWFPDPLSGGAAAITWDGQRFVAVDNEIVRFSSDGREWTSATPENVHPLFYPDAIAFLDSAYYLAGDVANGLGGRVYKSQDAITWTESWAGGRISSIASNGTVLCAVGWRTVVTSTDGGATWVERPASNLKLSGVASDGSRFIAVGGDRRGIGNQDGTTSHYGTGEMYTSPDGTSWTTVSIGAAPILSRVITSGGQWLAVGEDGTQYSSADGVTWVQEVTYLTQEDLLDIAPAGNGFLACGRNGVILESTEDETWEAVSAPGTTTDLFCVASNGSTKVAAGYGGTIVSSVDGGPWAVRTSTVSTIIRDLLWTGNQFIAVGGGTTYYSSDEPGFVLTSADGVSWSKASIPSQAKPLFSVAWNGQVIIAGGRLRSSDGQTWTDLAQAMGGQAEKQDVVTSHGSHFYALSSLNFNFGRDLFRSSDNGETWDLMVEGSDNPDIWGHEASGSLAVTGEYVVNLATMDVKVAARASGEWTVERFQNGISATMNAIAINGSRFVAVGESGRVLKSRGKCADYSTDLHVSPREVDVEKGFFCYISVVNGGSVPGNDVLVKVFLPEGVLPSDLANDLPSASFDSQQRVITFRVDVLGVGEAWQKSFGCAVDAAVLPGSGRSVAEGVFGIRAVSLENHPFSNNYVEKRSKFFILDADDDDVPYFRDNAPNTRNPDQSDFDGDGVGDVVDDDDDNDGLPDWYELANGLNPHDPDDSQMDSDGDGKGNTEEFLAGTDPQDSFVFATSPLERGFEWINPLPQGAPLAHVTSSGGVGYAFAGAGFLKILPDNSINVERSIPEEVSFVDRAYGYIAAANSDGSLAVIVDRFSTRTRVRTVDLDGAGNPDWSSSTYTTLETIARFPLSTKLEGVLYGKGRFVVYGVDADESQFPGIVIYSSTDGLVWERIFLGQGNPAFGILSGAPELTDGVFTGNQFALFGKDGFSKGLALRSEDGVNWTVTEAMLVDENSIPHFENACWNGQVYVCSTGSGDDVLRVSVDGLNWSLASDLAEFGDFGRVAGSYEIPSGSRGIAWTGSRFLAIQGGGTGRILASPDGYTWEELTPESPIEDDHFRAAAFNDNWIVAVGTDSLVGSMNGSDWEVLDKGLGPNDNEESHGVVWSGARWIVAGILEGLGGTGIDLLSRAEQDDQWTMHVTPQGFRQSGVIHGGGSTLVYGNSATGSAVRRSSDGPSWVDVATPTEVLGIPKMIWGGQQFVAVGIVILDDNTPRFRFLKSPDGLIWELGTQEFDYADIPTEIVWTGSNYSAFHRRHRFVSLDGIVWEKRPERLPNGSDLNDILWDGSQMVGVNSQGAFASPNGVDWAMLDNDLVPLSGNKIILWKGDYYIFGNGAKILRTIQNDPPIDIQVQGNRVVSYPTTAGTVVRSLRAVDPDSSDTFRYRLGEGEGDEHNHFFEVVGDELIFRGYDGSPVPEEFLIRLEVVDSAGGLFSRAVTLSGILDMVQLAYLKASIPSRDSLFGRSVAIDGDTVVVGSEKDGLFHTPVQSGAVYVFRRVAGSWVEEDVLRPNHPDQNDKFGTSVAISGDTVVIGASEEDGASRGVNGDESNDGAFSSGAAYVFTRSNGVWNQQAYLKASNVDARDNFGAAVDIDGDTIVVGALNESSAAQEVNGNEADNTRFSAGAAYVFVRAGGVWSQEAYLKANNGDLWDNFGEAVTISGDTIVIGVPREDSASPGVNGDGEDNSTTNSGAAYVFVRENGNWGQEGYLKAAHADSFDFFGWRVAAAGDLVVVGARYEASDGRGVNGDQTNNERSRSGAAFVFRREGNDWSQEAFLKSSNSDFGDEFGISVAISSETIVVGASGEDSNGRNVGENPDDNSRGRAGAAYVFERSGESWIETGYLKSSNSESDAFGVAVGISGHTVVVGAELERGGGAGVDADQEDNTMSSAGAAYLFGLNTPPLEPEIVIEDADGARLIEGFSTINFGEVPVGTTKEIALTIHNSGLANLWLLGITVEGDDEVSVLPEVGSFLTPLGFGESREVALVITPLSEGPLQAGILVKNNDGSENPFAISLAGVGLPAVNGFDQAVAEAGLAGPDAEPLAMPFGDGVTNLEKYAFNLNLAGNDSRTMEAGGVAGLPRNGVVEIDGESFLRVEYLRRRGSGLTYATEFSSTLSNGSFVAATASEQVSAIDDQWERVIIDEPYDPDTTPRRFSRVGVSLP